MTDPALSIVVVSDYAAGVPRAREEIGATLRALALQRSEADLEVIVCEDERFAGELAREVLEACPGARLLSVPATGSYGLKNAGAQAARAPLVAILDADCLPQPGWAAAALDAFRRAPAIDAVSGRTDYGGATAVQRIFALLTRAYPRSGTPRPDPLRLEQQRRLAPRDARRPSPARAPRPLRGTRPVGGGAPGGRTIRVRPVDARRPQVRGVHDGSGHPP